jgi:hypothetical protein
VGEAGDDQKDRARKVPKSPAGEAARYGAAAKEKITGRFFSAVSKRMGENRDLDISPLKTRRGVNKTGVRQTFLTFWAAFSERIAQLLHYPLQEIQRSLFT